MPSQPPAGTEIVGYMDSETGKMLPASGSSGSSGTMYPPVASVNQNKADLLDKIRPDAIVEIIRHKLMGEELINGKWTVLEALKSKAISESGAWHIANLMLPASSQNVSISKLNDYEIRQRTLSIVKTAQMMCLKNWKDYGIKGTDQLEYIHQIVMTNTFITLKQPEGAGIRKMIMNTTQENRVVNQQEKTKRSWGVFRH